MKGVEWDGFVAKVAKIGSQLELGGCVNGGGRKEEKRRRKNRTATREERERVGGLVAVGEEEKGSRAQ